MEEREETMNNGQNENSVPVKKEKKKIGAAVKESFSTRNFRRGAYTTVLSLIVIAVIVLLNLIVGKLDVKVDLTKDSLYTLTKQTKNAIKGVKDDVTVYFIASDKSADERMEKIVNLYSGISGNIKVEQKDPVLYPKFASQYTQEEVSQNSVIVVNKDKDKSKYIPYEDMIVTDIDYQTYQTYEKALDAEGQITSAIQFVTAEKLPVMYTTQGHGEKEINNAAATALAKKNVTTKELKTISTKEIPKDCEILLINGPSNDFAEEETKMITTYLENGGNAIIMADYSKKDMPNFAGLLEHYGVALEKGIIVEGDANYAMANNPAYLIPEYGTNDITRSLTDNKTPVSMPLAQGIRILEDARSTVTTEAILNTSKSAYIKTNVDSSTIEKEKGDKDGPFNLGVKITDEYNDKTTNIVVYSTSFLLDESMLSYSQLGNMDLFLNTINTMTDAKDNLSIPSRSTLPGILTVNSAQAAFWSAVVLVIIPAAFLIAGIVVFFKRRKR